MDRHPVLSIVLSVLIVAFFAVALYQPASKGRGLSARDRPAGIGSVKSPAGALGPSEFTVVQKGETLEALATRVYGRKDAVGAIIRANRDVLPSGRVALETGELLRTPPLGGERRTALRGD